MKKVIDDMSFFGQYFRVRQEVSDEIQNSIYFIKDEPQNSIENNIFCKKITENHFYNRGWTKNSSHYESYGKTDHRNEHNIREYDISG